MFAVLISRLTLPQASLALPPHLREGRSPAYVSLPVMLNIRAINREVSQVLGYDQTDDLYWFVIDSRNKSDLVYWLMAFDGHTYGKFEFDNPSIYHDWLNDLWEMTSKGMFTRNVIDRYRV